MQGVTLSLVMILSIQCTGRHRIAPPAPILLCGLPAAPDPASPWIPPRVQTHAQREHSAHSITAPNQAYQSKASPKKVHTPAACQQIPGTWPRSLSAAENPHPYQNQRWNLQQLPKDMIIFFTRLPQLRLRRCRCPNLVRMRVISFNGDSNLDSGIPPWRRPFVPTGSDQFHQCLWFLRGYSKQ